MNNSYNEKDSSISFILALFLPSVLAIFFILILSFFYGANEIQNSIIYKLVSIVISQIAFLLIYFVLTKQRKIKFSEIKHKKLNILQIFILLLISACCLFLISPIINVYDSVLSLIGIKEQTLPLSLDNPLNFVYLIFAMGIIAPISEELLFRGIILQGLEKKGTTKAVLISALMFMLMHLSLHQTIYQFLLGIIMALIVLYTQSIFASIFVHFVNNSVVLIINYINPQLFEYRYLTSNYIILAVVLFLFALFVLFYLLKWLKKVGENKKSVKNLAKVELTDNKNESILQKSEMQNLANQNASEQKPTSQNLNKTLTKKPKISWLCASLICGAIIWILNIILSL